VEAGMDYEQNYKAIIRRAQERRDYDEPIYTELHHILPKSLGGGDEQSNLVRLTAREHFLCHYLLAKMYEEGTLEWYKMNHAFLMMKAGSDSGLRHYNSRLYEALRGNFSSVMRRNQIGKNNSQFGTMWITDGVRSQKISVSSEIPTGWRKGRLIKKKSKRRERQARGAERREKGSVWITNGKGNKKIIREETVPPGWSIGFTSLRQDSSKCGGSGNKNSQYGKMWITDGVSSKKINQGDEIPKGWRKGRHRAYNK
jgi:hypothetical protein